MTKFFSKKGDGKDVPIRSQVAGIIWLSVVLLLIAGAIIFLPQKGSGDDANAPGEVAETTILVQRKDSAYRQRSHPSPTRRQKSRKALVASARYDTVRPARRQRLTVELNSADTLTLQLLHGIGPTRARRIAAYRERLGGFLRVEQLMEVYGIEPSLVADLAPHLTIDTSAVRKIDINTVDLKQLVRHPYIEYIQARDIVQLRKMGQRFGSADDLRAVPSMADTTLERLLPYIDFGEAKGL